MEPIRNKINPGISPERFSTFPIGPPGTLLKLEFPHNRLLHDDPPRPRDGTQAWLGSLDTLVVMAIGLAAEHRENLASSMESTWNP